MAQKEKNSQSFLASTACSIGSIAVIVMSINTRLSFVDILSICFPTSFIAFLLIGFCWHQGGFEKRYQAEHKQQLTPLME